MTFRCALVGLLIWVGFPSSRVRVMPCQTPRRQLVSEDDKRTGGWHLRRDRLDSLNPSFGEEFPAKLLGRCHTDRSSNGNRLAGPAPPLEQGLRGSLSNRGSMELSGDEPVHDGPIGPMIPFQTASSGEGSRAALHPFDFLILPSNYSMTRKLEHDRADDGQASRSS